VPKLVLNIGEFWGGFSEKRKLIVLFPKRKFWSQDNKRASLKDSCKKPAALVPTKSLGGLKRVGLKRLCSAKEQAQEFHSAEGKNAFGFLKSFSTLGD
jgi:hypothetical protein